MIDRSDDYKKYLPNVKFPKSIRKPSQFNFDMNSPKDIRKFAEEMEKFQKAAEEHDKQMAEYRLSMQRGKDLFHSDLIEDDLAAGIPKSVVEKIYNLAWESGHSSGFGAVEADYEEFAEIAREYHRILIRNRES